MQEQGVRGLQALMPSDHTCDTGIWFPILKYAFEGDRAAKTKAMLRRGQAQPKGDSP